MGQYDLIVNQCARIGCVNKTISYYGHGRKSSYCSKECRETMLGVASNIHNREMIAARNDPKLRHDEDGCILRRIIII